MAAIFGVVLWRWVFSLISKSYNLLNLHYILLDIMQLSTHNVKENTIELFNSILCVGTFARFSKVECNYSSMYS